MKLIRKYFLTGMIVLLPIILTIYLLFFFFNTVDNLLSGFLRITLGYTIPGLGIILTILVVILVGMFATNVIGNKFIVFIQVFLNRIPLVKSIYVAMKQIIDAFSTNKNNIFQRVVLLEYPRKGLFVIGFITGECSREIQEKTKEEVINVFVPTTPNPASGKLLLVPKKDIILLEMSVEDGLKLIISGGIVVPKPKGVDKQ
jgi:uncharacterized membrane protein